MYSEQELIKSNHNLLYLTPDFIPTAILPLFLFLKIKIQTHKNKF